MLASLCMVLFVVSVQSGADNLTECAMNTHGKVVEEIRILNIQPTLREYLSDLPEIYEKLEEIHMDDINIFNHINEKELDILCEENEIVMNNMDTIRFKTAIRRLRRDFASTAMRKIVAISNTEKKAVDEVEYALEETINIQRIFGEHLDEIEINERNMKSLVDTEVNKLINNIKERKKLLYKTIEQWKSRKLDKMKRELSEVAKYENMLRVTLDDFDGIFRDSDYSRDVRENKIVQKKLVMFNHNKLYESLDEYITINTQIMNIRFNKNTSISQLNQYGTFDFNNEALTIFKKEEEKKEEGKKEEEKEEEQETEMVEITDEKKEAVQSKPVTSSIKPTFKFILSVFLIMFALIISLFIWGGYFVKNVKKSDNKEEEREEERHMISG